jgi:pimeloyl-ACP methyl ester carboxylesterase
LQHFTAGDGARIAYEDVGSGRPLVLLHGLMAHRGFFAAQRALADDFRLILIDLRGHGDSLPGGGGPSVDALAQDVAELCGQLELEDAVGIGWSLGAAVLWRVLAGPASDRFAGAVVVDMTARVMNAPDWELGLAPDVCEARRQAIRDDFATFAGNAGRAIFAETVPQAEWAAAEFARNDPDAIGAIWASLVEQDFRAALRGIRQPTLIIHGAQSHLYGADTAEHLAATLPHARMLRFERSGHAPQIEEPELFNQAIQDFAAGLPRTATAQTTAQTGGSPSWP